MEYPTPSSTSKLEKVQPIEEPGLSFSPPPPNSNAAAQNTRASRYQANNQSESEMDRYSSDDVGITSPDKRATQGKQRAESLKKPWEGNYQKKQSP